LTDMFSIVTKSQLALDGNYDRVCCLKHVGTEGFSRPVEDVSATRIFARATARGRQVIAYEMQIVAPEPVAMILPIPTPPRSADTAVRFISLERYPQLFTDLYQLFHPPTRSVANTKWASLSEPLRVHEVGAFVASFVPSLADFSRLDPRFRIPANTIDRVDEYADWGFAAFQLAATRGPAQIHPMAFEFPTRTPERLFFPLVHVHDGTLPDVAEMDHTLYAQGVDQPRTFTTFRGPIANHLDVRRTAGIVDPKATLSIQSLVGPHPNRDLWVTGLDAL
jgi:hypothetical protein